MSSQVFLRDFQETQSLKEEHVLMNSIIRKTLGLKYHRVVRIRKSMSEIEIKIDRIRRRLLACGQCGQRSRVRDRLRERRWRHVPVWGIPVTIIYRPARVQCPNCGVKVESIPVEVAGMGCGGPSVRRQLEHRERGCRGSRSLWTCQQGYR